jgi:hypothetical protein
MEIYRHKFETRKTSMGDPMEENKKMIAAVSAVLAYLKEEEEMKFICMQKFAQPPIPASSQAPAASVAVGQWAASGRYHQMNTRTMMQMKAFHR